MAKLKNISLHASFNKVIDDSSLNSDEKRMILSLRDRIGKEMYETCRIFMRQDFDRLSLDQLLNWYKITYEKLTEFFGSFYLILNGINHDDPRWQQTLDFMRKLVIIAAAHDDVSDIRGDIGPDGKLREPNLFALFLKEEDRKAIGMQYHGKYVFNSMDDVKKNYPYAYKSFIKFIKESLNKIDLIPGINLHPLLEFYFFYFPDYFMIPMSPDSKAKSTIRFDSLKSVALLEKNIQLIARFRSQVEQENKITQSVFSRRYLDLISYLCAQQMAHSGLSLSQIGSYVERPISTISHWLNDDRLPLSLRTEKTKENINSNTLFYLLGIFSFTGSINKDSIKIGSKNENLLKKINTIIDRNENLISMSNNGMYLRYYNRSLASKLVSLKVNLLETLGSCSPFEQGQFIKGFSDAQNNKQIHRINKKVGNEFMDWLSGYYQRNNQKIKIHKKGNYYVISLSNGKNRLVEPQGKNTWQMFIQGDQTAKNTIISQYQNYAKKIIFQHFGEQKSEFWSELPSLMYLCLSQTLDAYKEKYVDGKLLPSFLKYQVLDYFRAYFKTNTPNSPTSSIDEVFEEIEGGDEVFAIRGDLEKVKQALKRLKEIDNRLYLTVALRYGLYDGKEHALTDDLPKRLFELRIAGPNNQILTKSQTYQLLREALHHLRLVV